VAPRSALNPCLLASCCAIVPMQASQWGPLHHRVWKHVAAAAAAAAGVQHQSLPLWAAAWQQKASAWEQPEETALEVLAFPSRPPCCFVVKAAEVVASKLAA